MEKQKVDELANQLSGHKGDIAREFFKRMEQGVIGSYWQIWSSHFKRTQAHKKALLTASFKKLTHSFESRGFMQVPHVSTIQG